MRLPVLRSIALNGTQKYLVAKIGSQNGVGREDDHGSDATSQRDPNDGEQELPLHGGSHVNPCQSSALGLPRFGWDLRDTHHVSALFANKPSDSLRATRSFTSGAVKSARGGQHKKVGIQTAKPPAVRGQRLCLRPPYARAVFLARQRGRRTGEQ